MIEDEFIEKLKSYLSTITLQNFSNKYDGMMDIVLEYNQKGIGRAKILDLLNRRIGTEELNDAQDEIFNDTYCRITRYASPRGSVDLKE